MKVGCNTAQRAEIMKIAELMQARIVDVSPASLTLGLPTLSSAQRRL